MGVASRIVSGFAAATLLCQASCGSYDKGYKNLQKEVGDAFLNNPNLRVGDRIPLKGVDAINFTAHVKGVPQNPVVTVAPYRDGNKVCGNVDRLAFAVCVPAQ